MLSNYIPIVVMLIVATLIAGGMVAASALLGPRHPTKYKGSSYECGITPVGSAHERFPIRFYLVAMLFIIFDIETIFLYPWAVTFSHQYRSDRIFLFGEMLVFVAILLVGYAYAYGKGALDWDERTEEQPAPASIWRRRPPIRFGNETSGPVRIVHRQEQPDTGDARADQDAAVHGAAAAGTR